MALVTMKDLLADAKQRHYCVGMFDAFDYTMAKTIVRTAEELRSPVMLATAEVLLQYESLEYLADAFRHLAMAASVPVCVFFDHGITYENIVKCISLGFTGVMFDGSLLSFEENVCMTNEIKKVANVFGCSVEAEIGHVGGVENEEGMGAKSHLTKPESAELFVERTNVDALAVAIGNIHGLSIKPDKLHIDLLREIDDRTGIPLVLHGGSGLPDIEIREAITNGVCKLNIWSELAQSYMIHVRKSKITSYGDWIMANQDSMAEVVRKKIQLFGSVNKA